MLKKKHVIFHSTAGVDEARRLLQAQTEAGSPSADNLPAIIGDTLGRNATPFRGEVEGSRFKVTRRVRGRRVRIELEGSLHEKPDGTTEIRAAMSPPPTLLLSLIAGLLALAIVGGGLALAGQPLALLLLLASAPVLGLTNRMYEAETSASFSALRDAIPANPLPAVAPISEKAEAPLQSLPGVKTPG